MFSFRHLPKTSLLLEQQLGSRTSLLNTSRSHSGRLPVSANIVSSSERQFSTNKPKSTQPTGYKGRFYNPDSKRNKIEQLLSKPLESTPPTETLSPSLQGPVEEALTFKSETDQTSSKRKKLVLKKKKKKNAPKTTAVELVGEGEAAEASPSQKKKEKRHKQKEKIEMDGTTITEENGLVRVERMRPDELLERWLAQFPEQDIAELKDISVIKDAELRHERLRQHFVLTLVSSLDPALYVRFITLFKQLLIKLRKLSLSVMNETKAAPPSTVPAEDAEGEDALQYTDEMADKQNLAKRYKFRQDMNKAKLTFFRNAARLFGDKADTLIPMLSKHLQGLTVTMLENARERNQNTDMMAYVASFLREDDVENILGRMGIEDGPVTNAQASLIYQHIDIENDQHSQYLWSRIDNLEANSYKVFVQNIPAFLTSRELMNAFSRCGKVVGCEIYRTRVTDNLKDDNSGNISAAIHSAAIHGSGADPDVALGVAHNAADGKLQTHVKGRMLSHKQLISLVRNAGEVRGPDCDPVYGFVYFKTKEAQQRALSTAMQIFGMAISDTLIYTQPVESKTCIVVSGLRRRMTGSDVRCVLDQVLGGLLPKNAIEWVRLPMNNYSNKGFAVVNFDTHEHARLAFRALNNMLLYWPAQPPSDNDNMADELRLSHHQVLPPRLLKCNWNEGKTSSNDQTYAMLPFFPDSQE